MPSEYGVVEMLVVLSSLLSAFLSMGLDSAQSFYFFRDIRSGEKKVTELITSIFQLRIIAGLVMVVVATIASPVLNYYLFDGGLSLKFFVITFLSALFSQMMLQSIEVFRLLYKPVMYIVLTLMHAVVTNILIVLFFFIFESSIAGFIFAMMLSSLSVAIWGWWKLKNYLDIHKLYNNRWRPLLKFGLPLVPTALAMYVMNAADKWFVLYYYGEEKLGIYAVSVKFAMILALVIEMFRKAWWPIAMEAVHDSSGREIFRFMSRFYMGVAMSACIALSVLSPYLVDIFTTTHYHSAHKTIGVLALYSVFYGYYLIVSIGLWKTEKTHYSAIITGAAAVINIVLNYILIPLYGPIGAAVATSGSVFIWCIASMIVGEYLWYVRFEIKVLIIQILFGILGVCSTFFLEKKQGVLVSGLLILLLIGSCMTFAKWKTILQRCKIIW